MFITRLNFCTRFSSMSPFFIVSCKINKLQSCSDKHTALHSNLLPFVRNLFTHTMLTYSLPGLKWCKGGSKKHGYDEQTSRSVPAGPAVH